MEKMYKKIVVSSLFVMVVFSGCSYRNDSNISIPNNPEIQTNILITEDSLNDKSCINIEKIDVSVKKLTAFHKDPTKEQANYVLSEKAKQLKANVVRNVKYSSGIGFTTWGYMDAEGDASKCNLD